MNPVSLRMMLGLGQEKSVFCIGFTCAPELSCQAGGAVPGITRASVESLCRKPGGFEGYFCSVLSHPAGSCPQGGGLVSGRGRRAEEGAGEIGGSPGSCRQLQQSCVQTLQKFMNTTC